MKNIITKSIKTLIFVGPFTIFFIHVLTEIFSQGITISSLIGLLSFVFAGVFIYMIWGSKNSTSTSIPKKLMTALFKFFCYFIWFMTISVLCLTYGVEFKCSACDSENINPIISKSGVLLDLTKGTEINKYDKDGWQSCGCRKVVSFDQNSEYALHQITSMNNYWTEHENCHNFLSRYKVYADEVNFNSNGPCYTHTQLENPDKFTEIETVIIYDKNTNQLFYHYYNP